MSKKKANANVKPPVIWTMGERSLQRCHEQVIAEVDHKGQYGDNDGKHIVTEGMCVYRSHQIINLYTGAVEELWLTKEQVDVYQRSSRDIQRNPIHPRVFDLPQIGLKPDQQNKVEGFHQSSVWDIVFDGEGHLWHGPTLNFLPKPYMHSFPSSNNFRRPELRFVYPGLTYIGPDDEELWVTPWGGTSTKVRLTIASYQVRKVIDDAGMLYHYFPRGDARTDVEIAKKEVAEFRKALILDIEKAVDERVDGMRIKLSDAEGDLQREQQAHAHTKENIVPKEEAYNLLVGEKERLQKEKHDLLKTVQSLEEDLEVARQNQGDGFDLSRV